MLSLIAVLTSMKKPAKKEETDMAQKVCLILEANMPISPTEYRIFSVGKHHQYFDAPKNAENIRTAAKSSIYPTNNLLMDLAEELQTTIGLGIILSGSTIELARQYEPKLLDSFKALSRACNTEFFAEPYYRALPELCSREEWKAQVKEHHQYLADTFGKIPRLYFDYQHLLTNEIAHDVNELGYEGILSDQQI